MDEVGLGKLLQQARQKAGLTQQELCQKAGLSYSTLAKIERGAIKSPSVFTIQSISAALGIGLDQLMVPFTAKHQTTAQNAYKRSKSGISFVYFDINGCIVRFFNRAFAMMAADTGATADTVETSFWHYNDAVCRGEMSLREFNESLARRLQVDKIDWSEYYLASIDPVPEMNELLVEVSKDFRVGLLSNIMPGFIGRMLDKGILPDIDYAAIIDSSEAHFIKPEAQIYQLAEEKSAAPADEILLVDDSRPNLMAAERFGWHVLWFDDYQPKDSIARIKSALEL